MTALKPPFTYFGGKLVLGPKIASLLPPHEHYIEPFAGSLAVLLAKRRSRMETVNDLDGKIMAFWKILRDRPADLELMCALTPHSRAEYQAAYEPVGDGGDDLEKARRVWVILTQGRGGSLRRTGWRFYQDPHGSHSSMPDYLAAYVSRIAPAAERLAGVSLECRPALEMIAAYGQHPGNLLYCDPPYLGTARAASDEYMHEMRGDASHAELAEALRAARATVVLSGYPSPLYDEMYADWYRHDIATRTGNSTDQPHTEVVWCNRPFPQATLFDLEAS